MNFKNWLFQEINAKKLILYHGSYDQIEQFKIPHSPRNDWGYYGLGFYLTPNPRLAKYYGPNIHKCEVTLQNPLIWSKGRYKLYEKYPNNYEIGSKKWASEITKSVKDDGYDGVIVIASGSGMGLNRIQEVCVYQPESILVIDKKWNMENAEDEIEKLRKQEPFFSQQEYEKFANNFGNYSTN